MAMARCGRLFLGKRPLHTSTKNQQGFIVLVPEIGEEEPEKNPLYHNDGLPKFNEITIENCRAAIAKQTLDFEVGVQNIERNLIKEPCKDVFKEIIEPLESLGHVMETTWGLSKTLYLGNNTLMPTSSYMAIHDRARKARITKFTSEPIQTAINDELLAKDKKRTFEETRILQKYQLEAKLNGLGLNQIKTREIQYCLAKLADERKQFILKNDLSTKQHAQMVWDFNIVRDFPENLLKATASDPNNHLGGPWRFTLQPHIYMPVLEYCPNHEIRWLLWKAHVGRGYGTEKELATSQHAERIRAIKGDIAKHLGYKTYVDMSMETKMAGSKEAVDTMISTLLEHAKPAQDAEIETLLEFAGSRGFNRDRLELWDFPYWKRKHRKSLYNYDENTFKEYFPLDSVLNGLYQFCENMFNIVIKIRPNVIAWHKDVRFYDVFESHSSAPIAGFYLDLHARQNDKVKIQNSAGWMIGLQSKSDITNSKPLAALIFNFDEPINKEKECFLSFEEVKCLFQKFGHSLQHLLTKTRYSEVAGASNVEWDAVEISGNVLLHWLYDRQVMRTITNDKLPDSVYENLCESQKHMAGVDLCRELYLSALDLELYSSEAYWRDIVKVLWPKYRSFEFHRKHDAHPCSFTQIFTEEWAAAYFSHLWSRMVAADVFSAFYEVRNDPQQVQEVGKRFRNTFLALGGSQHPGQIFREFRGRDPSVKALLKSLGLKKKNTSNLEKAE